MVCARGEKVLWPQGSNQDTSVVHWIP